MDISSVSFMVYVAIIPSILLCLYVYYMDVVEKEPIRLLLTLFFVGILITLPTMYVEKMIISTFKLDTTSLQDSFFLAFFVVALVEESYKFFTLLASTWKNKEFDYKYDAIVYSVFISLGFATLENIYYVYNSSLKVAIYRALISVPAHAFYAIAAGFFLGYAKEKANKHETKKMIIFLLLSFFVPILLHGLFDFLLLTGNSILFDVCFSFVGVLYVVSYYAIKKINKEDKIIFKK